MINSLLELIANTAAILSLLAGRGSGGAGGRGQATARPWTGTGGSWGHTYLLASMTASPHITACAPNPISTTLPTSTSPVILRFRRTWRS